MKIIKKNRFWLLIIGAIFISGFATVNSDLYFNIAKSIDTFGKVYREVSINYVDKINPENFMLAGIKGMLSSLDPYTNYIDETMKKDLEILTKGKYGGIGTSVGLRKNNVTILDLMEGYPAQRQGLRVGDIILKVDNIKINKDNYENLSNYLKGEPGKIVNLTIGREGIKDSLIFQLVLEEIVIKNVTYSGFIPAENVAYIKLSGFSRSAGNEVKNAILELKSKKDIQSIILDLRGNPGGLLDQAIDVSEKFLNPKDLIVSVMGRDTSQISQYYSEEIPLADKSKLVVLVDGGSASASEIVAGAIEDHDRGVIVGEKSFGKGLVQTVLPLSFNTSLKITTAKYYTPSGRCIQEIDYSNNDEIFGDAKKQITKQFYTDNKREVFANGGIIPDSIVSNASQSKQIQTLLARGMFFQFATNYFNTNSISNIDSVNDTQVFSEFLKYLSEHKFDYTSQSEKMLDEIEKIALEEEMNKEILKLIKDLESKYKVEELIELEKHKPEIICEIKKELASRLSGREGRILQSIKHDKQFNVALDILKNEMIYNKLLGVKD
ncbi:MAG: PDZ domain-containing protein [Bacteroidetes bacterium]|nr:PDZ domain-containing protein [Bacteroidota bacterium]MBU1117189.1 PDZ domain-containing protein [Bacteroidota bacterium]MBU1797888.1 PDZ domain-containing protein [Bacteroidota bacterium]